MTEQTVKRLCVMCNEPLKINHWESDFCDECSRETRRNGLFFKIPHDGTSKNERRDVNR